MYPDRWSFRHLSVYLKLIGHVNNKLYYEDLFSSKAKVHRWPFVGDVVILFRAALSITMVARWQDHSSVDHSVISLCYTCFILRNRDASLISLLYPCFHRFSRDHLFFSLIFHYSLLSVILGFRCAHLLFFSLLLRYPSLIYQIQELMVSDYLKKLS